MPRDRARSNGVGGERRLARVGAADPIAASASARRAARASRSRVATGAIAGATEVASRRDRGEPPGGVPGAPREHGGVTRAT